MDVLDEIHGLQADLARFQRSSPPSPFDDGFNCPLAFRHKKGEYIFVLREHFVLFSGGEHFILLVRACGAV